MSDSPPYPGLDPSIQLQTIEANGLSFEVLTCGGGDRLALCLHGCPEHAYAWRHQMPLLAELGYRVWAPNLRGYGNTTRPRGVEAYSTKLLLADVAGLIDASGAKEITLVGHDWGGVIAWAFTIRQIRPLTKLIIMNSPYPVLYWNALKTWPQMMRSWYIFFFQMPVIPDLIMGAFKGWVPGHSIRFMAEDKTKFPDEVINVYRKTASEPYGASAMINYYRGLFRSQKKQKQSTPPPPSKITVPTLMIWGEADKALDIKLLDGTEQFVEDFTLRTLPGVSHWVQQEAPDKVNQILRDWLKEKENL